MNILIKLTHTVKSQTITSITQSTLHQTNKPNKNHNNSKALLATKIPTVSIKLTTKQLQMQNPSQHVYKHHTTNKNSSKATKITNKQPNPNKIKLYHTKQHQAPYTQTK